MICSSWWEEDSVLVSPEGELCAYLCPRVSVAEGVEPTLTALRFPLLLRLWGLGPPAVSVTMACPPLGPVMGKGEDSRGRRALWPRS